MRRDPDALFAARKTKAIPFDFVLDELAALDPWTRPMFGCTAVYVDDKIVFILRSGKSDADNGVWIATTREHHDALRRELRGLRSIDVLGGGAETGWQMLSEDSSDFEENVLRACALVRAHDPRIGKVPKAKAKKPSAAKKPRRGVNARGSRAKRPAR
jgi:hypothetical protein